jgi:leucyl aminopeptidase
MPIDSTKPRGRDVKPAVETGELPPRVPLQLSVKKAAAAGFRTDVVVVGVFADNTLSPAAESIDAAANGTFSAVLKRGDLAGKAGKTLMLYDLPNVSAPRVLAISLGPRDAYGEKAFREALTGTAKALMTHNIVTAGVALADVPVPGRSPEWHVQQAARILADGTYRFRAPRARQIGIRNPGVREITLIFSAEVAPELLTAARRGLAIAEGMALTKDLGNLPGNICNPPYLAQVAVALGKEHGFDVEVLERDDMARLGMGSALSVGRASEQACKFIIMKYQGGGADAKPAVLVGKGVTFDTGGISLKPGDDLDMMKYDMCGAAAVIGTMKMAARLKLPINLIGIIAAVENMPGGDATRPGDVVISMSGQSIEILNTDAEGRLILCDALTYAERFQPAFVIDIATLTGACVIALGTQTSALFTNDEDLASGLLGAGTDTGDRAWRMPLWDEYQEQLKSNFADMSNIGGRPAGAVTAACFLARFTSAYPWAHLDIAGTASIGGDAKGATGRPVPLLSEFLIRRAAAQQPSA